MNRLSTEERSRIIACLVEGNSQRATVRMTGIAKKTVGPRMKNRVKLSTDGHRAYLIAAG